MSERRPRPAAAAEEEERLPNNRAPHFTPLELHSPRPALTSAAAASGGYLVTLTSEAENGFVHGLIADEATAWVSSGIAPNQTTYGPWIGLFQAPGSAEPADG